GGRRANEPSGLRDRAGSAARQARGTEPAAPGRRSSPRRSRHLLASGRPPPSDGRASGSLFGARSRKGNRRLLSPRRSFAVGHGVSPKPGFQERLEPLGGHRPVVGSGRPQRPAILIGAAMSPQQKLKLQLDELSRNLWWSWNPDVIRLFRDLDPKLFQTTNH